MVLKQKVVFTDVGNIVVNELSYTKFCELQRKFLENENKALNNLDVLYFVLLMSHDLGIDIRKALERKMDINDKKYSLEKAKSWAQKGIFKKYTELS